MNVPCSYHEFVIPVSRDRVFKAVVIDGHNLLPKLLSNVIKSVKLTKGDGGPGTISRTIFKSGREDVYRVDVIDPENYVLKATLIEGSIWMKERKVESLVYEVRYIASGPNKCIIQIATEFHPKEDSSFWSITNGKVYSAISCTAQSVVEFKCLFSEGLYCKLIQALGIAMKRQRERK
ncbi:major strawberry allergen Fra a 1.06-like [Punica granatum]|uniref:Major strawberry allergen Fra a 1.06-like n=1 Tax=Punica granatum TaxID=22663 RepID=A0A6P8DYZ2_PUNGR|nr:major strawberry allergen Fra a 1.06-like [Punica granatum]